MVKENNLRLLAENIRGGYGKKEIVHGVSFSLQSGDVLAVLGPNGCGKSTLLRLLLRFLPKTAGRVLCRGVDVDSISRKDFARIFSYIPQSNRMQFPYTVLEMVMMARNCHIESFAAPKAVDEEVARQCLKNLHIDHLEQNFFQALSGGQQQLVLIARALCQESCVLLMDEPTANLDFANQELICNAIRLLGQKGKIVIFTTHSPSQPFALANRVLLLNQGFAAGFGCPGDILTDTTLGQVYGLPMEVVAITDRNARQHKICLNL